MFRVPIGLYYTLESLEPRRLITVISLRRSTPLIGSLPMPGHFWLRKKIGELCRRRRELLTTAVAT